MKKLNRFVKNESQVSAFDLQENRIESKYESIINSLFKTDEPDLESAYSFYNHQPPANPGYETPQQSNNNIPGIINHLINPSIN